MGASKALLSVEGTPLLRRHVNAFAAQGLPVRVVLGPALAEHLAVLPDGTGVVWNARWAVTDMATSVAMGLDGIGDALVTPVDAPPADPDTLAALVRADGPCVPCHGGRDGHPVRVRAPHPQVRLDVRLADATRVEVEDPECVTNLNDADAFRAWLERKRLRCG